MVSHHFFHKGAGFRRWAGLYVADFWCQWHSAPQWFLNVILTPHSVWLGICWRIWIHLALKHIVFPFHQCLHTSTRCYCMTSLSWLMSVVTIITSDMSPVPSLLTKRDFGNAILPEDAACQTSLWADRVHYRSMAQNNELSMVWCWHQTVRGFT